MKPYGAMLLSVLLLVVQFMGAPSLLAGVSIPAKSTPCCPPSEAVHCSAKCCLTPANSAGHPINPAPVPVNPVRLGLELPALVSSLWALPLPDLRSAFPAAEPGHSTASIGDVPLFLRHAALLL